MKRSGHLLALAALVLVDAFLFAPFLSGARIFIGNADRFNHYLPVLFHFAQSAETRQMPGWDGMIFSGWNTLGLPWIFPVGYHHLLSGHDFGRFLYGAGVGSFALFFLSGASAYLLLVGSIRPRWLALGGALLYQCAFASTLRITQDDQTFAVLLLAPGLLWALRRAVDEDSWSPRLFLGVGCAALIWATFLQEAAYLAILLGGYLAWAAWNPASRRRALLAGGAAAGGLATGLPRLWLVGRELGLLVRQGGDQSFSELFEYQNVRPWELLRFLDGTIFGRSQSEAALSNLNITEGFQLFTAQASPFLLIAGFVAWRSGAPKGDKFSCRELAYFLAAFATTVAVVGSKWAYHGIYLLFGSLDFYHTRAGVAGLAPLVILITVALSRLHSAASGNAPPSRRMSLAGALLGFGLALLVHAAADLVPATAWALIPAGQWHWADPNRVIHVRWQAVAETLLTGAVVATVLRLAFCGRLAVARRLRPACAAVLCGLAVAQALLGAQWQLTGPQTNTPIPFDEGNSWQPSARLFQLPSPKDLARVHRLLEADQFRAAVLNRDARAQGLLPNSIARFFGLRLVDGYGTGVPANLAWLPWGAGGLGLRQVIFNRADTLPWRTLALTGVKHVWTIDRSIYTESNARFDPSTVLTNPFAPVPGAFFPRALRAAATAAACRTWMLSVPEPPRIDVEQVSIVRADRPPQAGGSGIEIRSLSFHGNQIEVRVAPAARPRFLVINSRWHPGWSAISDHRPVPLYETNGFMIGLSLPVGSDLVRLDFSPFAWAFSPARHEVP